MTLYHFLEKTTLYHFFLEKRPFTIFRKNDPLPEKCKMHYRTF